MLQKQRHATPTLLMLMSALGCASGPPIEDDWKALEVTIEGDTSSYPWEDQGEWAYGQLWLVLNASSGKMVTYVEKVEDNGDTDCTQVVDELDEVAVTAITLLSKDSETTPTSYQLDFDTGWVATCEVAGGAMTCTSEDGSFSGSFESSYYTPSSEHLESTGCR